MKTHLLNHKHIGRKKQEICGGYLHVQSHTLRGSHLVYNCWFVCNRNENEIKKSRSSNTYNQVIKQCFQRWSWDQAKGAFSASWSDQDLCTPAHACAHIHVTVHVRISKVSVHLDPGCRWINSCILGDYPLYIKQSNETHPLNHRHIGGKKRGMCWLLTASYIKQFNENSPPKSQT